MLKYSLTLACALMLSPTLASADARTALDCFAEDLESLSGQFTQITLDADGFVADESSGQVYFKTPDRFRWRYLEPFPQDLVADGTRLWHYDESLDQVTVRDQPEAAESPLLVLTRPELLERFYAIEPSESEDVIQFRPLSDEGEFETARLYFVDGLPSALELNDRFGQLTRLELTDLVRNPELDDELFQFVPPEGADILEGY